MAQIHGRLVIEKKNEVYLTISTEDSIRKELSEFFKFKVPGASFIPAVRKKFWDGYIRLFHLQTNQLYLGLYTYLKEFCEERNYEIEGYEPETDIFTIERYEEIVQDIPLELRDYQKEAVAYAAHNQKCILVSPTASGKSLMIYATMNPSTYGGTHELNKDFEDRFTPFKVPYPSSEQEFEILEHEGVPENIVRSLIQLGMELRASMASGDLDSSPSPRTNQMFCDAYRVYESNEKLKDRALQLALTHVILNKFQSPKQAETVAGRMQRVFGGNVNQHAMDDD